MNPECTRRRLLAATAAGTTVVLAGCLGTRDGPVPAPVVTDDRIEDGWRLVDESSGRVFEADVGPVTVRALAHTLLYEHVGVAEALADALDAEGSPVLFFASRIDLRPALDRLPFGVGRDRVTDEVEAAGEAAFRERLREEGVADVTRTDRTTTAVDSGHDATVARFVGRFAVDGEVTVAGGATEPVGDELEIVGRLANWHDGTDALVAGGVYPAEPFESVLEDAVGDESVDLVDVVDAEAADALSREPASFGDEVTALMLSVE